MAHIALAVRDQERSRRFYETYFEFNPLTARVAEDGVLLIEGPDGILLALAETDEAIRLPSFLHFGFRAAGNPVEVRAFRDRLAGDGIEIVRNPTRRTTSASSAATRTAMSSSSPGRPARPRKPGP
jgi:catechol 2,3-dioxygenase-like lactoylglutathione lyase family enzyme